jgi:OmcA/MtrC family decaheme c-type cytochrome
MDIAATENCNRCHDPLAIHGGGRIEIEYCVTCHNAGSTDANSANTVDMKVMVHKIHMGRNLPSVQEGGEYAIWGFRDSKHDYSHVAYPQDIRNCVNCHVGTGTIGDRTDLVLTSQGDNWAQVPTRAACGSCHENVNFDRHAGGQPDDSNCASCHATGGIAGSVEDSHLIPIQEARKLFLAEITDVDNSSPGEQPMISFKVSNPQTGEAYDIMNDPEFTSDGARLAVGMAWSTSDYENTGNGSDNASQVQTDALANASANGDGSFTVTMPLAIPDGSIAPNIAATGSGVATVEGHPVVEIDGEPEEVPVGDATRFFSIDEADGSAVARRESVTIENCLTCHGSLVLHGGNRADNIDSCVSCHNPRNTDRDVREIAANPPTDGKQEESIDFKTMVHGIHASAMRENALQVVGFRGFTTYVYDEEHVQYPGDLSNCVTCHTQDGYKLPLASSVLGTSIDTGDERQDPTDDMVTTPATAVCASCHDDALAKSHMESNGGNFSTSQAAIDSGEVIEECAVCHGSGRNSDVAKVHGVE